MKYLLQKDKKRRQLFEKFESERLIMLALSKDKRLPLLKRIAIGLNLLNYTKDVSKSRIKNRCVITGRARSVVRDFKMSRIQIRELSLRGTLYGVRKASW
jgi:ribosomal protein S14